MCSTAQSECVTSVVDGTEHTMEADGLEAETHVESGERQLEQPAEGCNQTTHADEAKPHSDVEMEKVSLEVEAILECPDDASAQGKNETITWEVVSESGADDEQTGEDKSAEETVPEHAVQTPLDEVAEEMPSQQIVEGTETPNVEGIVEVDAESNPEYSNPTVVEELTERGDSELMSESDVCCDGAREQQSVGGLSAEDSIEATACAPEGIEAREVQRAEGEVSDDVGEADEQLEMECDVEAAGALEKTKIAEVLHQAELPEALEQANLGEPQAKDQGAGDLDTNATSTQPMPDIDAKIEHVEDLESTEDTAEPDSSADNDAHSSDQESRKSAGNDAHPSDQAIDAPSESGCHQTTLMARKVQVFPVQAAAPQDLFFKVPKGAAPGHIVAVQGPHGPMQVQVPRGAKPGKKVAVRLAAQNVHEVFVPAGAKPGQTVSFLDENNGEVVALVPPGKKPGQVFHVSPPVVMLPVPFGAVQGDLLTFTVPAVGGSFKPQVAAVPANISPGQYFSVRY